MLLFVFDRDCMDSSVHIWSQGSAAVMSAPVVASGPFLQAVAGSHGRHARHGWPPSARRGWAWVGRWNREIMPPVVGIFVGLLSAVEGRSGPGVQGGWRRNRIFSWPSLRGYSHILLDFFDPWKGPVCGISCGRQRCRRIHWRVAIRVLEIMLRPLFVQAPKCKSKNKLSHGSWYSDVSRL